MLIVKDFFNFFAHDLANPFMCGEFPGVNRHSVPFNAFQSVSIDLNKVCPSIAFLIDTNGDAESDNIDLGGPRLEIKRYIADNVEVMSSSLTISALTAFEQWH
jgi:hypothetical protein